MRSLYDKSIKSPFQSVLSKGIVLNRESRMHGWRNNTVQEQVGTYWKDSRSLAI